jgi:transposase
MRPFIQRRPILRARHWESRQSDLGVFPEVVLWWFRAKRNSGSATQAIEFLRCIMGAWRFSRAAVAGIIMPTKPTIIELDMDKLESVLRRAEANELTEDDCATIHTLFASYVHLLDLLKNKKTSIDRLRKLLFGASTEKLAVVLGEQGDLQPPSADASAPAVSTVGGGADAAVQPQSAGEPEEAAEKPVKGHGRNGADAYTAAEKIDVPHESLQAGDPCPNCGEGTVYQSQRPGVLVRLVGQAPLHALVYYLQKLRCNLCGAIFTARAPGDAGEEKYDATAGSMVALMKYGTGMPFNRLEGLQADLGIPLPSSTQWDIVEELAEEIEPVFEEFLRQAADGEVVFNDDTGVKILELMGERARQAALEEMGSEESVDDLAESSKAARTGLFTTGIVSTRAGQKIALFLSGRQHAGENLKDVLVRRTRELPPPIQMCDALSRNLPGELQTILGNCLAHGRRQFVDVAGSFPEECRHVLESLAVVYHNDDLARERKLSPEQRLAFHQTESGPTMEELHVWLERQFQERRVEPNSALGGAISYLLKHWEKLTLFLRVAGAPLDNNIVEQALKKAILHRKNALFYKTCHGAHVGDVFMSLIYTCELCGANPFDYLTELKRHAGKLSTAPQNWLPWNYRQTLDGAAAASSASP